MTAASVVSAVRKVQGLNQREFGKRVRFAQSQLSQIENGKVSPSFDSVEKILKRSGQRLVTVPTTRDDAAEVALNIAKSLEEDKPETATRWFFQLNQDLASEHGALRFALAIAEPPRTGRKNWDAAIAAVCAHYLAEEGLPFPSWVESEERTLERTWILGDGPYAITPDRKSVPPQFLCRKILVDRDSLVSA